MTVPQDIARVFHEFKVDPAWTSNNTLWEFHFACQKIRPSFSYSRAKLAYKLLSEYKLLLNGNRVWCW